MELNPEKDLEINTADLTAEFKSLPLLLFRYYSAKAAAEREYDKCKQNLDEIKAATERLQNVAHSMAQQMYGQPGAEGTQAEPEAQTKSESKKDDDDVVDADYKEV